MQVTPRCSFTYEPRLCGRENTLSVEKITSLVNTIFQNQQIEQKYPKGILSIHFVNDPRITSLFLLLNLHKSNS